MSKLDLYLGFVREVVESESSKGEIKINVYYYTPSNIRIRSWDELKTICKYALKLSNYTLSQDTMNFWILMTSVRILSVV